MVGRLRNWNKGEKLFRYEDGNSETQIVFENNKACISGTYYDYERIGNDELCAGAVISVNSFGYIDVVYSPGTEVDIFVTNRCNSNCIMCPLSEGVRREKKANHFQRINDFIDSLPEDVRFINITGGEPTLAGEQFFQIMDKLKTKFQYSGFQLLTNGRSFSNEEILSRTLEVSPRYTRFTIPVHSSDESIHDAITQSPGSFRQTDRGIKRIIARGERVEVRVVVSKVNSSSLYETAQYIVNNYPGAHCVTIVAMEMMGNAALNRERLWIDYDKVFSLARDAISLMIKHGIDVLLYNFPLCSVDRSFWPIAVKSITEHKIRYMDECAGCNVRQICGGLFESTKGVMNPEVKPVLE